MEAQVAKTVGVILAGGRASRIGGGDKPLLALGEATLLDHVIARLRPQCAALAINANGDPARLARFGLPVIPDTVAGLPGPLAGILAGMEWAATHGSDSLVSAAGDTPFLPEDLVGRLRGAGGEAGPALAASVDANGVPHLHPTFGIWPVALREELRAALERGERKVAAWAQNHGAAIVTFPVGTGADPFFNVNTPDDLERARALFASNRA
jgi:molybdenum cofactor guanylyltransferase